jgi:hypothetical protein
VNDDIQGSILKNIHNVTSWKEEYIKVTTNGKLIWSINYFDTYLEYAMNIWKKRGYEMSNKRCTYIEKFKHWFGTKLHNPPIFDGIKSARIFIDHMEEHILEEKRVQALDAMVKGTPIHRRATHN